MTHLRAALLRHKSIDTLLLAGMCLVVLITAAVTRTHHNELIVELLEFHDGYFYQNVHPATSQTILGDWAAEITDENGRNMCSGGGRAPYEIKNYPKAMTPDDWTGDRCELVSGQTYKARAVWQWTSENGMLHSVERGLELTYQHDGVVVQERPKRPF